MLSDRQKRSESSPPSILSPLQPASPQFRSDMGGQDGARHCVGHRVTTQASGEMASLDVVVSHYVVLLGDLCVLTLFDGIAGNEV